MESIYFSLEKTSVDRSESAGQVRLLKFKMLVQKQTTYSELDASADSQVFTEAILCVNANMSLLGKKSPAGDLDVHLDMMIVSKS